MTQMYRDPKTFEIIGAAMDVHRELGSGFLEAVYQETLSIEFGLKKIPFQKEVELPIRYKEAVLSTSYRAAVAKNNDRQIAEKYRQIAEKRAEQDRQVESFQNSYSWKATSLLRKVLGLFKK